MEFFKGDPDEVKVYQSIKGLFDNIGVQAELFYSDTYNDYTFGGLIFDEDRSPLTNAIRRDIFIESFNEIFSAFVVVGTPEAYLTVFRKIFGDDVEVEFEVPAAGKLNINITASGVQLDDFVSRYIADNQYFFDDIVTQDDDEIVFQSFKGFESQYELELMLREMVPAGIFTTINLDFGS